VPFASYPEEWCAAMLKDAALAMVELLTELAQYGLTLKDAHPWNILFDAWKPVYVDLPSIMPIKDDAKWPGYDQFCRFYLYPLILMAHRQDRIARRLLPEYEGVSKSDLLRLTQRSLLSASLSSMMGRLTSLLRQDVARACDSLLKIGPKRLQTLVRKESHGQESHLALLKEIKREVESITLPSLNAEELSHDENSTPSISPQNAWTAKQHGLHKILAELRPGSVLDIGSISGWYSKLAALFGSTTVSFDTNSTRIAQLYYDARDGKLSILPLVMDFTDPTPSRGLSSHWSIAATERFQCDMVVALALVHQIVFKRCLNFDQIVEGLALFSKRWLVVEFVPAQDEDLRKCRSHIFSWYTLDNFISTLRRRFHSVSILPSHPKPRVLLLCEK